MSIEENDFFEDVLGNFEAKLIFGLNDFSRIALRALAMNTAKHDEFEVPFSDETTDEKCFTLVKDDGIYLIQAYPRADDEPLLVIYADGFDPRRDEDVWEKSQNVSGDDFAENIFFSAYQLQRLKEGSWLGVSISETEIGVYVEEQK